MSRWPVVWLNGRVHGSDPSRHSGLSAPADPRAGAAQNAGGRPVPAHEIRAPIRQDPAREVAVLPSRAAIDAAHRLTRDVRLIALHRRLVGDGGAQVTCRSGRSARLQSRQPAPGPADAAAVATVGAVRSPWPDLRRPRRPNLATCRPGSQPSGHRGRCDQRAWTTGSWDSSCGAMCRGVQRDVYAVMSARNERGNDRPDDLFTAECRSWADISPPLVLG
jgi:hypothetical protein